MPLSPDDIDAKEKLIDKIDELADALFSEQERRGMKGYVTQHYNTMNGTPDKIQGMAKNGVESVHMIIPLQIEVRKILRLLEAGAQGRVHSWADLIFRCRREIMFTAIAITLALAAKPELVKVFEYFGN